MTPPSRRRIVVLDDDPTGTQGVAGLPIVLRPDADTLGEATEGWDGPLWVLTNTRAMNEADAVRTLRGIVRAVVASVDLSVAGPVEFVLRGDSTLRGHVIAEFDALASDDDVFLFVPAFLEAGRVTVDGIHFAEVAGQRVEVADTEYAQDHEFGYRSSRLTEWVAEHDSGRVTIAVAHERLRAADGVAALRDALLSAPAGAIVLPDAETAEDLDVIAAAWNGALDAGRGVVLRCAASLAGVITESPARAIDLPPANGPVLVVCGSYTAGARDQLAALDAAHGPTRVLVDITEARAGRQRAAAHARSLTAALDSALSRERVVVLSTPRSTIAEHLTLEAGEAIMDAVIAAVAGLGVRPGLVISKGGITGARVARDGFAAATAMVLGQPAPGVPVWQLELPDGARLTQVVVPGNVGSPTLIAELVTRATGQPPTAAVALP